MIHKSDRLCDSAAMAQDVCVIVRAEDGARVAAVIGERNRLHKHVQRARIVVLSADRLAGCRSGAPCRGEPAGGLALAQRRYGEEGVDGLLHDKTRPPGKPPLAVAKVLAPTCAEPPGETTHWTGRAMAETVGMSLRAVQRLREAHHLQPHRIRTVKRSNDPAFAAKVEDIVGLSMNPPRHAVVLSVDEKRSYAGC
jgi:hypothetical protein